MGEPVKTRRAYDNSRRQAQVQATRAAVTETAKWLFAKHGYPATTLDLVATESGIPLPTVYRLFGSKRALLSAVLDVAIVGDDAQVALHDRPEARAAAGQTDARALLAGYARLARGVLERSHDWQQVLRSAAVVDVECAELLATKREQRAAGQKRIIDGLRRLGALRKGLAPKAALDTVYALMSPELHHILTVERGCTNDQYEAWLAAALQRQLLNDGP